jgi:hypothetical protein
MKHTMPGINFAVIIASTVLWASLAALRADSREACPVIVTIQTQSDDDAGTADPAAPADPATPATPATPILIQTVEIDGKHKHGKEVAWLGLAVEEASEALSSQLGLKPGEGLTVTLLAEGSPAEKADLHKNDVLVELDGQMLVHPLQLRKLVQMHAEGDSVKITFFRAGKKQTISAKLAKTTWEEAADNEETPMPGDLQHLKLELKDLNLGLRGMSESLARAGLDKAKVNSEVKRTMEQTHKALQDAVRRASDIDRKSLVLANRQLEALARDGVDVDDDATVIVRDKRDSSKTMVETDDSGSYIIEAGAKTHLTARDKHGKLLFEGFIDTPAEQEKVPKEVWEKAKPMFDQIAVPVDNGPKGDGPKGEDKSGAKPNSRNKMPVGVSYMCA